MSSGAWANVIAALVVVGAAIGVYAELRAQQAASVIVNTGQDDRIDICFDAIKEAKSESVDREILQRLTAVETKIDDLRNEKRKR